MGIGWFGFFDHFLDDAIVAVRQGMAVLVPVEGGREALDVNDRPYSPFMSVRLLRKDSSLQKWC